MFKEPLHKPEGEFGRDWMFFGEDPGLKAADLIAFSQTAPKGLMVTPGISIGASYYDEFLDYNGFSPEATEEQAAKGKIPPNLRAVNRQIVDLIPPGSLVMFRSSARDEKGGTGVYESYVMPITGDRKRDLKELANNERWIYANYLSPDGKAFREGEDFPEGMAILIQPLVGAQIDENHIAPLLSGVMTYVNGEPTLRLVIGMGTKAVEMDEALVLQRNNLDPYIVERALDDLTEAELLETESGWQRAVEIDLQLLERARSQVEQVVSMISHFQAYEVSGAPQYWEFAIDDSAIHIVQATSADKVKSADIEMGEPKGQVLCEGTDVVNLGYREGRGIIWFGYQGFDPKDRDFLERFNRDHQGYLVIFPDKVFSQALGGLVEVGLRHFSNAAGVVELQFVRRKEKPIPGMWMYNPTIDHSRGRGGAHFTKLCSRKDIMFLGIKKPGWDETQENLLGENTERMGTSLYFWDVPFAITNTKNGGRVELTGEVTRTEYPLQEIKAWADQVHEHAYDLDQFEQALSEHGGRLAESGDISESEAFYLLRNLLASCINSTRAGDTFGFINSIKVEEILDMLTGLRIASDHMDTMDDYEFHRRYNDTRYPLLVFTEKIIEKLESRLRGK